MDFLLVDDLDSLLELAIAGDLRYKRLGLATWTRISSCEFNTKTAGNEDLSLSFIDGEPNCRLLENPKLFHL